jgi:hypothetical protein
MFKRVLQIAIPFVWFGMVAAISFMEAPLKFQAPGITIPLGLGIGRLIFWTLNKIEIVLAIVMLLSLLLNKPRRRFALIAFGSVAVILLLETVWLLPLLDARATDVINGTTAPFSNLHLVYIVFDAIKLLLLFGLGVNLTSQNLKAE